MMIKIIILILFISSFGTYIIRKIALNKKIIDIPNTRSSHTEPTPRGGGLAIVISWFFGITILHMFELIEPRLFFALISGVLLAFIGLMDDIYTIKPWIRILFQLVTVFAGLYFIGGLTLLYFNNLILDVPLFINVVIIIGGIWFINLYNFLDGIDGYASVEAIAIAIGCYIITQDPVLLLLIFSVIGFLVWNWPRAKIFMGDIGSTQLGYITFILGIYYNNNMELNIFGWLILSSLFWFDATITLYRRWRNKEKLSQAHKKHAYQRIVQFGYSHQKTVIISIFVNAIFIALIFLSEKFKVSYYITFFSCLVINGLLIKKVDSLFPFESSEIPQSK